MKPILQTIAKPIIDTIAKQPVVVEKPVNDTLEILSKVNEFYDSAWSKLIFLLAGTVAVLGIIVPYVIQHFQNKSLKASEKELESKLNMKIEEARKTIEAEITKKFESKLLEHEENFEKKSSGLNGQILYLEANSFLAVQDYKQAFKDFCLALSYYSYAEDLPNTTITLDSIKSCLNHLTKDDVYSLKHVDAVDIAEILNDMEETLGAHVVGNLVRDVRAKLYQLGKEKVLINKE